MSRWTHYPRKGDRIKVAARDDEGLRADGHIVLVDREAGDVLVKFSGRKVVVELNYFEWNGKWTSNCMVRIDGIAHHWSLMCDAPWMMHPGGDMESYPIEELMGNWSSNNGGEGAWII